MVTDSDVPGPEPALSSVHYAHCRALSFGTHIWSFDNCRLEPGALYLVIWLQLWMGICSIDNLPSILTYLSHSFILIFLLLPPIVLAQVRNVTVPVTSPELVFTPFICNSSTATNTSQVCEGAWKVLDLDGSPIASTSGPAAEASNVIPQMFLRFHAREFYLSTSPWSNATANITVSSNTTTLSSAFNASIGSLAILNIPESTECTVVITYVPSPGAGPLAGRLDIGQLILTITDNSTTSSIFPTQSLPNPSPLPSITISTPSLPQPTSSPTELSSSSHEHLIALGVGIVLGLGLGLTGLVALGYLYWRRRRRRQTDVEIEGRVARRSTRLTEGQKEQCWF